MRHTCIAGLAPSLIRGAVQGHPAKNDHSTEVLREFCTRATFLRGVPVLAAVALYQIFALRNIHGTYCISPINDKALTISPKGSTHR